MNMPWVSRKLFEAQTDRAVRAEVGERLAEERKAKQTEDFNQRLAIAQGALAEANAERKLLIDRIVEMSGQPAIFHPAPIVQQVPSSSPAPAARVSFDDVHKKAREAIRSGKLNLGVGK
jgi:hypothetical protein